jgi:microcystin-dependent protein
MGTPYISEIRLVSFNYPPKGWAFCNGQLLAINQNQALFALLGTTYGGNGQTTFALPNLQGATPLHMGNGFVIGQTGGEVNHTLLTTEMPAHSHPAYGVATVANLLPAANNALATSSENPYSDAAPNTSLNSSCLSSAGGSQPHNNLPPYLALTYVIALQGIFPSQN